MTNNKSLRNKNAKKDQPKNPEHPTKKTNSRGSLPQTPQLLTKPTQNPARTQSTNTKQTTRCGGGLGDAPVHQQGAWGETPQILTNPTQNPARTQPKNSDNENLTQPKIQLEPNQPTQNKQPVAEGVWGTRPSTNRGLGGRPPKSRFYLNQAPQTPQKILSTVGTPTNIYQPSEASYPFGVAR